LIDIGPVLQVLVEVPTPLAASFRTAGTPVPQPASGLALIDTGATCSAVDDSVVQALGVQPIGVVNVGTAGGIRQQAVYSARFSFPGSNIPAMEFAQLTGVDLRGHVVPHLSIPLIALIGRDILSKFVMIYNGPNASITLAF
jgi:predicted aspartyl protease